MAVLRRAWRVDTAQHALAHWAWGSRARIEGLGGSQQGARCGPCPVRPEAVGTRRLSICPESRLDLGVSRVLSSREGMACCFPALTPRGPGTWSKPRQVAFRLGRNGYRVPDAPMRAARVLSKQTAA